ncbi:MAG: GNAT family N-acetyltransferase [Cyanobacteria bacterium K_Offshore_surface_m2_239]|nr:GNAT family N-acetyltransferase [Cyanobacteria bacterium K_Offshore_surface_m2_239]
MRVRPLLPADWAQVVEVYADAVRTLAAPHYCPEQIDAWASHPSDNPDVSEALARGQGLVGCPDDQPQRVEGFALLDPADRLSLLYCRGRSSRQGLATCLVRALEEQARARGQRRLRTEASRLSRPLLERLGWSVDGEEEILFAGQPFVRWRMSTALSACPVSAAIPFDAPSPLSEPSPLAKCSPATDLSPATDQLP